HLYANLKEFMARVDKLWSHEKDVLFIGPNGRFDGWKAVRQGIANLFIQIAWMRFTHHNRVITIAAKEASLFHNCGTGGSSAHCFYKLRKEDGAWRIYSYISGVGRRTVVGPRDTLAPDDENELRRIIREVIKPALEDKDIAILESINSEDIAFITSKGERKEGWDLVKNPLSTELDALKPTLEEVTIYIDLKGNKAFAFDEEDSDLKTSFWLSKIEGEWKLIEIDFTGEKRFMPVKPKGKLPMTWGELKRITNVEGSARTSWASYETIYELRIKLEGDFPL
nr:hypothetical protein [bacterium]